jgi:hypothetical protein
LRRPTQITGLRASSNNYATTVLNLFLDATVEYGTPSCLRGDREPENVEVATYIIMYHGLNRASFIWGPYVVISVILHVISP